MDRLLSTGSKRPSLIPDNSIILRLPSWTPHHRSLNQNQNTTSSANNTLPIEGEFFNPTSNLQYHSPSGKKSCQGSTGMLIDIVRLLGQTNTYLSAGGVKGDSHFPWHSLSTLSKIRSDLDIWASGTSEIFSSKSIEALFGQQDSSTLVLSKLIYHLIHVLIYRPFLPIDLVELSGTGQHQSWQIEATNLCFLHANAIAELVELGMFSLAIIGGPLPSFSTVRFRQDIASIKTDQTLPRQTIFHNRMACLCRLLHMHRRHSSRSRYSLQINS